MATITAPLRKTGIAFVGDVPWGTHVCHFFETTQDLLDTVLPFFKEGLDAREFCLWVVAEPLTEGEATSALRRVVPDLDRFLADGSIEIHPAREWYLRAGAIDLRSLIEAWDEKLAQAVQRGFTGMRANACEAWLREEDWLDFSAYEERLDEWIADKRMIILCSYRLANARPAAILDVARTHNFAMAKRKGTWEVVETPEFRAAKAENRELRIRNRRQSAVADLGLFAIRATDLAALMDKAALVAAETLEADLSGIAELVPEREEFRVLAGVGWEAGYVGGTLSALGTPGRWMLVADEAIVVGDLRTDRRFEKPQVLLERGVVSLMAVIIRGRTRPWGLLSVHSRRRRTFSPDEVGFLQSVANLLALAVERHALEVAQQREKEILEAVFDNSPVMISFYDTAGRLLRVNKEWERTFGWTLEAAQQLDFLAEAYPDPERLREVREFIERAEGRWAEFRPRTRDGKVIDTQWMWVSLSDGSLIGFGLDITERKQAEQALRESEARFRQLAENIHEVVWLTDLETTEILYVSPAYEGVFGRSRESLYREPRSWLEAVHPEDRERVRRLADENRGRGEFLETYRVLRPDGSERWVRDRRSPIRNTLGQTYRYAGIVEDITARRLAEEERARLLQSESAARAEAEATLEQLRAIHSITDAALSHLSLDDLLRELLARLRVALRADVVSVRLIDDEGKTLYARAIDGLSPAEVAGVRIPLNAVRLDAPALYHEFEPPAPGRDDWYTRAWSALGAPLRAGMTTPLLVEGKAIGLVGVASKRAPFTEEDLRLLQVVADRVAPAIERGRLMETVRAGRAQLQALSRRILTAQEEERRRLAVELHDELGQVLTAVKINLASLERQSGTAPPPAHLRDALASVDRALERVRELALDLRPSVLDDLGLAAALRWYTDRFARTTRIETHLSVDAFPHLGPSLETACFRVAQEALTNVARHAQARNVWVDLHVLGETLELGVRDDGIGFEAGPARERAVRGGSMGLLGLQERVSLSGGELELVTRPGGGTEVRARFPLGGKAGAAP
jgi:PAS domain S-box-containing protein